jgi:hypothetical protein
MSPKRRVLLVVLGWLVVVSVLHLWLNLRAFDTAKPEEQTGPRFRVGFLPVT